MYREPAGLTIHCMSTPSSNPTAVPRLVPTQSLPPRTYIPGRTTKLLPQEFAGPIVDDSGHSWQRTMAYGWGCELFNHGYYWEAHEVWEGLWHRLGRVGPDADFLKGLIKLAAAGVKVCERRPEGVIRHCRRAIELFRSLTPETDGPPQASYGGLSLSDLIRAAEEMLVAPPSAQENDVVTPLYKLVLIPSAEGGSR